MKRLETRWNGPRIVFNFCKCPLCTKWLEFSVDNLTLKTIMLKNNTTYNELKSKVVERLKLEGREKDKELSDPKHPFY